MFENHGHSHNRRHGLFSSFVLKLLSISLLICGIVFVYNKHAKDMQLISEKATEVDACTQKKDSLSAQLQVTYEHKSRLDKLLEEYKEANSKLRKENEEAKNWVRNELEAEKNRAQACDSNLSSLQSQLNSLKEEKLSDDNKGHEALNKVQDDLATAHRRISELEDTNRENGDKLATLARQLVETQQRLAECGDKGEAANENKPTSAEIKREMSPLLPKLENNNQPIGDQLAPPAVGGVAEETLKKPIAATTLKNYVQNDSVVFEANAMERSANKSGQVIFSRIKGENLANLGANIGQIKEPAKEENDEGPEEDRLGEVPDPADPDDNPSDQYNEDKEGMKRAAQPLAVNQRYSNYLDNEEDKPEEAEENQENQAV